MELRGSGIRGKGCGVACPDLVRADWGGGTSQRITNGKGKGESTSTARPSRLSVSAPQRLRGAIILGRFVTVTATGWNQPQLNVSSEVSVHAHCHSHCRSLSQLTTLVPPPSYRKHQHPASSSSSPSAQLSSSDLAPPPRVSRCSIPGHRPARCFFVRGVSAPRRVGGV